MKPNIFVGLTKGSAMYRKWYYEVIIDQIDPATHLPPTMRIGWANTEGFIPYPGGGEHWGGNGVGDNLYSYAFDGTNLWTGKCIMQDAVSVLTTVVTVVFSDVVVSPWIL